MSLVKNCVDVWSHLFDHKPFLRTELNLFVNEFEESRRDREIVNLLDVLNIECEVNNHFDVISNFDIEILKSLNDKVESHVKQTNDLLKSDKSVLERSIMEIRRKQREASWKMHESEAETKYSQFDDEIARELEQIKNVFEKPPALSK